MKTLTETLRQEKRNLGCNQNNLSNWIWPPVTLDGTQTISTQEKNMLTARFTQRELKDFSGNWCAHIWSLLNSPSCSCLPAEWVHSVCCRDALLLQGFTTPISTINVTVCCDCLIMCFNVIMCFLLSLSCWWEQNIGDPTAFWTSLWCMFKCFL